MPKIIVTQPFKFAHHGYRVEAFEPAAEPIDTSDECAAIAVAEGWAVLPDAAKAMHAAPENKDAAPRHRVKAAAEAPAADPSDASAP